MHMMQEREHIGEELAIALMAAILENPDHFLLFVRNPWVLTTWRTYHDQEARRTILTYAPAFMQLVCSIPQEGQTQEQIIEQIRNQILAMPPEALIAELQFKTACCSSKIKML